MPCGVLVRTRGCGSDSAISELHNPEQSTLFLWASVSPPSPPHTSDGDNTRGGSFVNIKFMSSFDFEFIGISYVPDTVVVLDSISETKLV